MPDLEESQLSVIEGSSTAKLAINLIFKLLAGLREMGKLNEDELTHLAKSMISELTSDHDRFLHWELLERLVPDYKRPDGGHH